MRLQSKISTQQLLHAKTERDGREGVKCKRLCTPVTISPGTRHASCPTGVAPSLSLLSAGCGTKHLGRKSCCHRERPRAQATLWAPVSTWGKQALQNVNVEKQVYGAVMNINRGNPFQKEVVLDSWPDFKAVITRRQKEAETDNLDHYTNAYAVFYKDVAAYRRLLEERDVINWDQVFQIQGLQSELYDISRAVATSKQVDVKLTSFKAVRLSPGSALPDTSFLARPAPRLTRLRAADAELLDRTWSRGGNAQCRRYLARLLACFPSACVRDGRGRPVSWALTDQFATVCHGYTLPEHRRRGYSRLVALALAAELQGRGFPAQANVLAANAASIGLLRALGAAEFLPCGFHRLILTPAALSGLGPASL